LSLQTHALPTCLRLIDLESQLKPLMLNKPVSEKNDFHARTVERHFSWRHITTESLIYTWTAPNLHTVQTSNINHGYVSADFGEANWVLALPNNVHSSNEKWMLMAKVVRSSFLLSYCKFRLKLAHFKDSFRGTAAASAYESAHEPSFFLSLRFRQYPWPNQIVAVGSCSRDPVSAPLTQLVETKSRILMCTISVFIIGSNLHIVIQRLTSTKS